MSIYLLKRSEEFSVTLVDENYPALLYEEAIWASYKQQLAFLIPF